MTQATGGMSGAMGYVGLSTDGSTWTDVSGYANSVEPSGGDRDTGNKKTHDGDTPILTSGKRNTMIITILGVYTETAAQYYAMVKTAYEGPAALYARWSPGGGDAGDKGYTTSAGVVISPPYPAQSAEDAAPVITKLVLECASVTESTVGTAGW